MDHLVPERRTHWFLKEGPSGSWEKDLLVPERRTHWSLKEGLTERTDWTSRKGLSGSWEKDWLILQKRTSWAPAGLWKKDRLVFDKRTDWFIREGPDSSWRKYHLVPVRMIDSPWWKDGLVSEKGQLVPEREDCLVRNMTTSWSTR